MVYNSQKGSGFHSDLFGTLNRTFKPVLEGAADVGANLATGLVSDLLSGKTPKASIKERGNQAKGLVAQRALQSLQGGSGTKRKRSRSKSQPVNPKNKRELERNVNPGNKRDLENKLEQGRNVNPGLERKVNPENRLGMVCGQG